MTFKTNRKTGNVFNDTKKRSDKHHGSVKPKTGLKRNDVTIQDLNYLNIKKVTVDEILKVTSSNHAVYYMLNRGWNNLGYKDRKKILDDVAKTLNLPKESIEKHISEDDLFNKNSLDRLTVMGSWRKLDIPVILY